MLALVAAAFVGAGIGAMAFGLPGVILGSTVAVMAVSILLLNRE